MCHGSLSGSISCSVPLAHAPDLHRSKSPQSRGAVPWAHTSTKAEGSLLPLGFWKLVPFKGWEGHGP